MGISRLENFIKSIRGTILYVDPNSLDSTDSIENQGNSPTRPFKTIQRALIESARFSYQAGLNNDRFNKTTIMLYPGDHIVDNRPGLIVQDDGTYAKRSGARPYADFGEFTTNTNFDLNNENNILYKFNSIHGGVIVPRGTSIVGTDLRKTKIIPKYIPNPENDNIERSAIFRLTGACFIYGFTILDADPNGLCFKDYTSNQFVPNFSHHKLTAFEYADGVNGVYINDDFINDGEGGRIDTTRTDLNMYYEKVAVAYGESTGDRQITLPINFPDDLDIQPLIDEYRIVGSRGKEFRIQSISAIGDIVTVNLEESSDELTVNSPIKITGVESDDPGDRGLYNGEFVIFEVVDSNTIKYRTSASPVDTFPNTDTSTLSLTVDTVTSASPYVFNISLRSVYGMCGMHADGSKADGFKSMVVAQFTGIGLQKDDNAFVRYSPSARTYVDANNVTDIHTDSRAVFKPEYKNYHIKASNDAFIQLVSIFAIGYASHFVSESGGDLSITNSNSNFGANALIASGYRKDAYPKDDVGYITHIIPPKELGKEETPVEFLQIDVGITTLRSAGAATTSRLYLYDQTNFDNVPLYISNGFKIGSRSNDNLYCSLYLSGISSEYSSRIVFPGTEVSSKKEFKVVRSGVTNSIQTNGIINLELPHNFELGEKVVVISENGDLPDGIKHEKIYYVINRSGSATLTTSQIKLAESFENSFTDTPILPNNRGGKLKIVSRVSDKIAGDVGHPIQWDGPNSQWYIGVSTVGNTLYTAIRNNGVFGLGKATQTTYVKRIRDNRDNKDKIYKFRYVIPKNSPIKGRPPIEGFVIQESNTSSLTSLEHTYYYNPSTQTLNNSTFLRNPGYIAEATWSSGTATIKTELPHNLSVGSQVDIKNIRSGFNTTSEYNRGFNGTFEVTSTSNSRQFTYALVDNPGSFTSDTVTRNENLPTYSRKTFLETYQIYQVDEIQPYEQNVRDGIYHLTAINSSNSPNIVPFSTEKYSQPIQNLYPQLDRDNADSDPKESASYASPETIGEVFVDNVQNSITKENLGKFYKDFRVGFGITNIISSTGTSHTIYTDIDHGLAGITSVTIVSSGSNYVQGSYYGTDLVGFAGSVTGSNASARITVNSIGQLSNIVIMDGGSNYGIGNTLTVIPAAGIGTTTGFTPAVIRVDSIVNNVNDTIKIYGLKEPYDGYNTVYSIVGFATGSAKQINVSSASIVNGFTSTFIGLSTASDAFVLQTGKVLTVSTFSYNSTTGVGIVTFSSEHGLNLHNKVVFGGFNQSYFNQEAVVTRVRSLTSLEVNLGYGGAGLSTAGSIKVYPTNFDSFGGDINELNENIGGRSFVQYDGITSYIRTQLTRDVNALDQLIINNAFSSGFRLGDYLQVNNEIFRIKTTVSQTSDVVQVFRSLLGTKRQTHDALSIVKKIKVLPVEFHRNSIIRSSGHTFEYVGFGPGNYSTAFPERQDRSLTDREELLSQAKESDGGIVFYTGMNDEGNFYTGNKKINSATGTEEVFDSPVPSVAGENINEDKIGTEIVSTSEVSVSDKIKVDGGRDKNIISEFEGPVTFNNKVINYSDDGFEAPSIYVQGEEEVARKFTVGISTPTYSANYGDIVTRTEPQDKGTIGWVYVTENKWVPWGYIGDFNFNVENLYFKDYIEGKIVSTGIGTTSYDGSVEVNVSVAATSLNTYNEIVSRDSNGAFFTQYIGVGTYIAIDGNSQRVSNRAYDYLGFNFYSGRLGVGTTQPIAQIETPYVGSFGHIAVGSTSQAPGDGITIHGDSATLGFIENDAPANQKRWVLSAGQGLQKGSDDDHELYFQCIDDSTPGNGSGHTIAIGRTYEPSEGSAINYLRFSNGYDITNTIRKDWLYIQNYTIPDAGQQFVSIGSTVAPKSGRLVGTQKVMVDGNIYLDCRQEEHSILIENYDTYCYFYGANWAQNQDSLDPQGDGFGFLDGKLYPKVSNPSVSEQRNVWYYSPRSNEFVIERPTIYLTDGESSYFYLGGPTNYKQPGTTTRYDGTEMGIRAYAGSNQVGNSYTEIRGRGSLGNQTDNHTVFHVVVDGDPKIRFTSSGRGYWDGNNNFGNADYAEYFEWLDGNPNNEDRVGYTVVLENGKMRFATELDDPMDILGVISGSPAVVGDSAWSGWQGKYATDEFGRKLKKEVPCYFVKDKDENVSVRLVSDLPKDFEVPSIWELGSINIEYYSNDYDPEQEYVPRSERKEWDAVGLLGKLYIRKGQPVGDRWIKLEDVNENVEKWLVK